MTDFDIDGAWEWVPNVYRGSPSRWRLDRAVPGDPHCTVLYVADDGWRLINPTDVQEGEWWLMRFCTIGPFGSPAPTNSLVLCESADHARGQNYYFHDYVARIVIADGDVVEVERLDVAKEPA